jgi:glycosyltransferase involved in cell wall biosynthesis
MKILVTNHQLKDRCGSELFTFNLVKELKNKGHEVLVFSPVLGKISDQISQLGIIVTKDLRSVENEKFDIIHAQHNTTAILVRSIFPETPIIFMSHGVLPELEQAPSIDLGISRFLAVSEEVAKSLEVNGKVPREKIEIIRNFIDTEQFIKKKDLNIKAKNLLVISNHYTKEVEKIVEGTSKKLNLDVKHIGFPDNSVENVEDYINNSDIVISLGRGVLEAMACERNVIVYDTHGGDGAVNEENFFELRKNNFSGRRYRKIYTNSDLETEISKFDPNLGKKLRELVLKENSKEVIIKKIEKIYFENLNNKPIHSQLKKYQLYNELSFLEKPLDYYDHYNKILEKKNQEIQERIEEIQHEKQKVRLKNKKIEIISRIVKKKNQEIETKIWEIQWMKSSRFWKLKTFYEKFKKPVFNIMKLIKKAPFTLKRDGLPLFIKKVIRYFDESKFNPEYLLLSGITSQCVLTENLLKQQKINIDSEKKNKYKAFTKLMKSLSSKRELNVSVIIATYNRSNMLNRLLKCWEEINKNTSCSYEIIFSDDGSSDDTLGILRSYKNLPIIILENDHHGASSARNNAIEKAKGELLIFTGDDIFPGNNFIEKHWLYYKKNGQMTATLGRIEWQPGIKKTHLMTHITEIGCEQFGFVALPRYSLVDFRHFYTSNISISALAIKALGKAFDLSFKKYGFEDIELGYRLAKEGMKIFYAPDIVAFHDHVYNNVEAFCNRQSMAGEMLATFKKLHPELSKEEIHFDIDTFKHLYEKHIDNKSNNLLYVIGLNSLMFLKSLTKIIENLLKYFDLKLLRKICSLIYRNIFAFYFYYGLATGLNADIPNNERMKFAYKYLISSRVKTINNKEINQSINFTTEISNNKDIWVQVRIDNAEIVNTYKKICKPLLPNVIISDKSCPLPLEYRSYRYEPTLSTFAINKYGFLNAVFCLSNYNLDFIVISNSLEIWPVIGAQNLESSIIYSAKFESVEEFLSSNSNAVGKFIKLKTQSEDYHNQNISQSIGQIEINGAFLSRGVIKSNLNTKIKFNQRVTKNKPLVFVFPAFMAVGGVERNTIEMIRNLRDKLDFVVITWENHTTEIGSLFHQLNDICVAYFDLAQVSNVDLYLKDLETLNKIYDPDIVWVPNSNPWYFQNIVSVRKIFENKVMISQDVYDIKNGWITEYNDPIVKKYERYIAINQRIKNKFIEKYNLPVEKIDLIYPAINTDKIMNVNSSIFNKKTIFNKYNLNPSKLNFAFIGRLTNQKQPLEFVKLVKNMSKVYKDIDFIMVGDGVLGDEVDELIEEFHIKDRLKRINFIESVYEFTKAIDGLIIISIYEGLPIVAIEAMCLGTPIMGTDVGDLALFVNKYDIGVISNDLSAQELEKSFIKFVKGITHFKKQAQANMKECVEFFSSRRASKLTLNCFELAKPGITNLYLNKEKEHNLPLVSVIIPSYNHRSYIEMAVSSVLSQTYENVELIVIDDGSKDNSVDLLKKVKDKRLTLIEQKNQGAHNAINKGLSIAKGEFFAILNSDDVYHPDRIRQIIEIMNNDPKLGLVCSWIDCIDSNGSHKGTKEGWHNMEPWPVKNKELTYQIDNDFVKNLLISNFISTTSNMVFRREVFEKIGGMRNLRFAHDWDFALRVAEEYSCKIIEYPLVQYRLHSTNTIKTNRKHMLFEICWIYAVHIPMISKKLFSNNNYYTNMIKLMGSLNLQGNDKLILVLITYINDLRKKGKINPEELLLNNSKQIETFFNYIQE